MHPTPTARSVWGSAWPVPGPASGCACGVSGWHEEGRLADPGAVQSPPLGCSPASQRLPLHPAGWDQVPRRPVLPAPPQWPSVPSASREGPLVSTLLTFPLDCLPGGPTTAGFPGRTKVRGDSWATSPGHPCWVVSSYLQLCQGLKMWPVCLEKWLYHLTSSKNRFSIQWEENDHCVWNSSAQE